MMNNQPNHQIRCDARLLTRQHLGRLLLMSLITFGIIFVLLAAWLAAAYAFAVPALQEAAAKIERYSRFSSISPLDFLDLKSLAGACAILFAGIPVIELLSLGLSMGFQNGLIRIARGERPPVSVVFSRMKNCFTAYGLNLWMSVKLFLWALPGLGVALVGAIAATLLRSEVLLTVMPVIIAIVTLVCIIIAAYRYAMAIYFAADDPRNGAFGSVKRSTIMMTGRKFELFRLTVPYALLAFLIALALELTGWVISMLPLDLNWLAVVMAVILCAVGIVTSIYLTLLTQVTQACYYAAHCGELASAEYPPLYRMTLHNSEIRRHAIRTVHRNIVNALVIDLLNGMITGVSYLAVFIGMMVISGVVISAAGEAAMGLWLPIAGLLLMLCWVIVIIGLNLGRTNAHIRMSRDSDAPVTLLFSRMRNCMGGFGLGLWIGLKIFLWMLAGAAIMLAGVIIAGFQTDAASAVPAGMVLATILIMAGYVLMFVFIIRCAYRYAMAHHIYADRPQIGVFSAAEHSRWMMEGAKLQLFRLHFPFTFAASAAVSLLLILVLIGFALHAIAGVVLTMLAVVALATGGMYLNLLTSVANACFYTRYSTWDSDRNQTPATVSPLPALEQSGETQCI